MITDFDILRDLFLDEPLAEIEYQYGKEIIVLTPIIHQKR